MGPRRTRDGIWGLAAGATTALGLASTVALWGLWVPVTIWFGVAVTAFSMAKLGATSWWISTRLSIKLATVTVACVGLVAAFAWAGALLILMVVATSPLVRILLRTGRFSAVLRQAVSPDTAAFSDGLGSIDARETVPTGTAGPAGAPFPLADMPSADGVPGLDDRALCHVWRRSYVRLEASRAAEARLEVVGLRQLYLDELVRRHPAQMRHWLASGARAAGNPLPFLGRPVCQHGTAEDGRSDGPETL